MFKEGQSSPPQSDEPKETDKKEVSNREIIGEIESRKDIPEDIKAKMIEQYAVLDHDRALKDIEIDESRKKLEEAEIDELTLLPTRKSFFKTARNIINGALYENEGINIDVPKQQCTAIIIAIVDLDKLKQINDKLGHPYGDAALKAVGLQLKKKMHITGHAGRLGGDEFIYIESFLTSVPENNTLQSRLNTIRESFIKRWIKDLSEIGYKVSGQEAEQIASASIGAALIVPKHSDISALTEVVNVEKDKFEDIEEAEESEGDHNLNLFIKYLIKEADKKMYQHKGEKNNSEPTEENEPKTNSETTPDL